MMARILCAVYRGWCHDTITYSLLTLASETLRDSILLLQYRCSLSFVRTCIVRAMCVGYSSFSL